MTTFSYDGAIQTETIAVAGFYDIAASGGQGGSSTAYAQAGGLAASSGGDIFLQAGAVLEIVVGGAGSNTPSDFGAGGGGGSFVIEINNGSSAVDINEVIAGGGGGAGSNGAGGSGLATPTGGNGGGSGFGAGGLDGAAGAGGVSGGGGGGFAGGNGSASNGTGSSGIAAGSDFVGGAGGAQGGSNGGFGGGGGGGFSGGGGGGGFGGGGGGGHGSASGGGGGGSYVNSLAASITQSADVHTGDGQVSITPVALAVAFNYDGSTIQYETIAVAGIYDIAASGGQGGNSTHNSEVGGSAASSGGDVFLQAGAVLEIVVGGAGGNDTSTFGYGGGGGGGSFVIETNNGSGTVDINEVIAGGGGGAGFNGGGGGGGTAPTGGNGGGSGGGGGGVDGAAGAGGIGGGGGGGFAGGNGASSGAGGSGIASGSDFAGGAGGSSGGAGGGFGGGGGGGFSGGGGGGGFGGGGGGGNNGGSGGAGGGSYVNPLATVVTQSAGGHTGNGQASIAPVAIGQVFNYDGSTIQYETIAVAGIYYIGAAGGQGGNSDTAGSPLDGGLAASSGGDVFLQAGAVLEVVVGGAGSNNLSDFGAGGGGGSFVIEVNNGSSAVDLNQVIAGGGGGAGYDATGGSGLVATPNGGNGGGVSGGSGGVHGAAGTGGHFGGGGGGFAGGHGAPSGGTGANGIAGGSSFAGGGDGEDGTNGGFGGGGGGGYSGGGGGGGWGGGGGGGYKGTASGGGGGGSYVNPVATGVTQSVGVHTGNGQVTVAPAAIAKAFSYDGAVVQYDTIAVSGTYDIVAAGGQGGSNTLNSKTGGLAASSGGDIFLQAGAVLEIVVGGAGSNDAGRYGAGGGGGSFVIEINNGTSAVDINQVIAGGGGGAGSGGAGGVGLTAPTGGNGGGTGFGAGGVKGAAGSGGVQGGGGGGFQGGDGATFGGTGASGITGGSDFAGGAGASSGAGGGFGGGGGGGFSGGGGGGGFGGGGGGGNNGGSGGAGGGSYVNPLATGATHSAGVQSGNGFVDITPAQIPTSPGANWIDNVPTSLLATTIFVGEGPSSTLVLTGAGTFSLANVSDFGFIDLPAGNNTVTVTDKTLSGGPVTINDGASGNNTVTASSDTSASKGKSLTYVAGTGTDSFTGGFENDTVDVSAAAVGGDTLTGGSGTNTLVLTGAGNANLSGVTKFPTIDLAATGITLPVTDALLSSGSLTVNDQASGNTISATGDTSASKGKTLTYNAGSGTDSFTGGFENDKVNVSATAVGSDTLTGGSGTNTLTLTSAGSANLGGVSKFATIFLAAGSSTVTLTDTTLSGGAVTLHDGASGNNSISAVGDTSASTGKTLTYYTGTGTDSLTGGFENDVVYVTAAAVGGDTLTGGSGTNTLNLTTAGTVKLGGVSNFARIFLAAGNSTVTVTDTTLSGGSVTLHDGASGNNTISAASDTAASTGKTLTYYAGTGTDKFTGGFENDVVYVTAAAVGGDTLTGGHGTNTLELTTAGTFSLGGVGKFGAIFLGAGNNTVTVADKTLTGGSVTLHDGASGNNTVSATSDTSASKGKTLTYDVGTGTDSFTGGFENDVVYVKAASVGGDTLTGGSGTNTLELTTAGTFNLGEVSKFGSIVLGAGNNTVTVTDTTLSSGSVALHDGASGNNSVSATGDTAASTGKTLTYYVGTGTDKFTGGFENDTVRVTAAAVGGDTLIGGSGTNLLVLTSAGSANLGGVSGFATIFLDTGNTVTVTDTTLSAGSVKLTDRGSGTNSVSAAGDTAASTGKLLTFYAGTGADSLTGGFENDLVYVRAAAVGGDTLTGGSGTNTLELTTAGSVNLGGVSKFGGIFLAAGNSTVTVTDKTLSSGSVSLHDGASGNNTVSAASDTSASTGKTLTYFAGVGTDHFTGGFENDTVRVTAAAVGGDTLTGGKGTNTLVLTSAGAFSLGGVSKFATIDLAAGTNTVTVTDKTLSGGSVAVHGGAGSSNSVSAAGDTSASTGKTLTYYAGTGTDTFTGGFENDTIVAVAATLNTGDAITGGSGTNTLMLSGGGTFNLAAPTTLTNIQTVDAAEGQAAGGGVPNGVQTVDLRAGLDQTINVASGTPNPLDPNPETITINGAANNDVINLGAGTDTVVLGGTGETVNGGGGMAFIDSTSAFAGALVNGTAGGTTTLKITTGGTATLNANDSHLIVDLTSATNLTLSQLSFITAVGSTGNDTITAMAQGQTLTGGGGTDTLNGYSGFGDVFSDTSAHLNTTTIGNFGGSDTIDLTDMNSATIQPLAYNTGTETLTVTDGTHTSHIKFVGSYTLADFQPLGSDGHTGSLIGFV